MTKKPNWDVLVFKPISYLGVVFAYEAIPYKIGRYGLEEIEVD